MIPAEVPAVPVYAGDTCTWPAYTFKTGDAPIDLAAEGWTGWAAAWRRRPTAEEAVMLTVDSSRAAEGVVSITASAEQTRAMGTDGVWDLQAERDGEVRTFLRGTTTYLLDITRD